MASRSEENRVAEGSKGSHSERPWRVAAWFKTTIPESGSYVKTSRPLYRKYASLAERFGPSAPACRAGRPALRRSRRQLRPRPRAMPECRRAALHSAATRRAGRTCLSRPGAHYSHRGQGYPARRKDASPDTAPLWACIVRDVVGKRQHETFGTRRNATRHERKNPWRPDRATVVPFSGISLRSSPANSSSPRTHPMSRYANSGTAGFTHVQQRLFAVPIRRMWCIPFVGRARMRVRSPFAVGDMMLRDERYARMAS